ncbi:MAG: hypothetical protein L3I99_07070 [Sulfurimonas sp.]|nr:hypothetical protein [Sulfurimonas sp.]
MKVFFIKNKILIFRVLGSLMLLVGFMMFFWTTPKDGLSTNEMAAANIARMEARAIGGSGTKKINSSSAEIMKAYKDKQEVQKKYTLIIIMILGVGFLGYSFVRKKDN